LRTISFRSEMIIKTLQSMMVAAFFSLCLKGLKEKYKFYARTS